MQNYKKKNLDGKYEICTAIRAETYSELFFNKCMYNALS